MIAVIGSFRIPPERLAQARPAMERVMLATRAEAGCVAYSYAEDVLDRGLIRVSEMWETRADLTRHFAAAHMMQWQQDRAALGLSEREISAYEVGPGEPL